MDPVILGPMLASAILFLVVVTHTWKTSISATIHAVTGAAVIFSHNICHSSTTLGILVVGILINMGRAVLNTDRDHLLKRDQPLYKTFYL